MEFLLMFGGITMGLCAGFVWGYAKCQQDNYEG